MFTKFLKLAFWKKIPGTIWRHKKLSSVIAIILIIFIYFALPKDGNNVLTQKAVRKDIVKTVSVTGDVSSDKSVDLSFQTPELLSYVGVKLGDSVKKGQEIAALDSDKLAATVRQTQQDFIAAKAASQQYYDNHTNATESDEEKVARTAIDDAQNKAYDQYLKAQYDLNHSVLYSPIDGVITRMDADTAGENVTSATIFTVTDPNSLSFKMEVDQADVGKVKVGQNVNVSLDAFPNTNLKLQVESIDFVSHKTSSGGNAFYVKATLPIDNTYRVGMSGNADIIVDSKQNVLTIPTSSVFNENYAYVEKNKKFYKTKIVTGIDNDIDIQVISGLSEGETVALDASSVPQKLIAK